MTFSELIERIGQGVDGAGVGVIVLGLALATTRFLVRVRRGMPTAYQAYREGLGRTLLLGLEFLVAADIIRTVAITPTFRSVGILAIIVAIRTFLSWALELELSGHWPWQRRDSRPREDASAGANEVRAK